MQRANRAGQPLLYCSLDRGPVFFELGVQVGTRLAIIQYETTQSVTFNRVGYTAATFERLRATRALPDYTFLREESYTDVGRLVNDFLAEVFCEIVPPGEHFRYKLSTAISEKLVTSPHFDGLMYPTIPMWGNADNVAFKPERAHQKFRPVRTEFVEVTKISGAEISFNILDEARRFEPSGEIGWLGHQGQWQLRHQGEELQLVSMPGGYWEARDTLGNVREPE